MSLRIRLALVWLCLVLGESVVLASTEVAVASSPSAAAPQCSYSLQSTSASFPSTGFTGAAVSVITGASCSWIATSNAPWLVVTAGSGTGLSTVRYDVAPNTTGSTRVGTLTIAGLTFTVTQAGNSCVYSLQSTSASFPSTGFTGAAVSVITGSSCSWIATSNAPWLVVTAGSGTGLSTVRYDVAPNTTGSTRVGTLTIAGLTFTVTQAGNSCAYSLGSTSASFLPVGFTGAGVSVITGTSCSWTATSNAGWLTITGGASGTGISSVTYNVAANTTGGTRVGTLTIAGITFTVTQTGTACTYTLSANSVSVPATASSGSVSVTTASGCTWSAASNTGWITVTGGASGSGNGAVSYSVAANPTSGSRIGTLLIAGKTFSVTQAAGTPPRPPTNLRIVK